MKTKSAKATKKNSTRNAIPYERIAELAEKGLSAMEIAEKTDRVIKGDDPTHSIRAIISKMRTSGWKGKDGKVRKLKVERLGVVKQSKKSTKPAKKAAAKKAAAKPVINDKPDGKTLAAGGQ
jgi:hypothetical protein